MLQWVALSDRPSLALLVHHTDAGREFANDVHADKVFPRAKREGWTVIDMKRDWGRIYPETKNAK